MPKRAFALAVRLILGLLFVWAAVTKLPDMAHFSSEVAQYRLLPSPLAPAVAWCVVATELGAGLLLLGGAAVRIAARVVAFLLIVFIVALSQALLRGLDLTCGCFGGAEPASWGTVARDLAMLAACLWLARLAPAHRQQEEWRNSCTERKS